MPDLRLVMFDFDGTLVDSQWAIAQVMAEAFAGAGLPPPPAGAVRRVVGLQLEVAIDRLLPEEVQEDGLTARLASAYRAAFFRLHQSAALHEPLMSGVKDALETIEYPHIVCGIATAKGRRALVSSLERHGLARHFTVLKTADDGPGKPHPRILLDAMAEVGVGPEATLMVGDTTYDMELAVNAGARALGVAWGYHAPADLLAAGAERVLEDFAELTLDLIGLEERR